MTPRSRKPLIITSEQRDSLPQSSEKPDSSSKSSDMVYQSMSPKNDSDFVSSSDDENAVLSKSSVHSYEHNNSNISAGRSESTHFVVTKEKRSRLVEEDLNTTLCGREDGLLIPQFKISHEVSQQSKKSLTEPFREYLLSRSVLTATPVDLSLLNKSNDDKLTDSLMFCLDGNVPMDLTSSINNLAVEKNDSLVTRSPLKNLNGLLNIDASKSPNRKRGASSKSDNAEMDNKKLFKENMDSNCELRETDL